MLINFLGTFEFLEHSGARGVQPDAEAGSVCASCKPVVFQMCGPHGRVLVEPLFVQGVA